MTRLNVRHTLNAGIAHALVTMTALMLSSFFLEAQDFPRRDFNPEKLVDEIFGAQNFDINYQELYENLLQLLSRPLDLNTATPEEIRSMFVLREDQMQALMTYRRTHGPFLSVYELQAVPGFDLPTIYRLTPFVQVRDLHTRIDKTLGRRLIHENDNYFLFRSGRTLEKQKRIPIGNRFQCAVRRLAK